MLPLANLGWGERKRPAVLLQEGNLVTERTVGAPAALCIFSETCGHAVALEHNGDLYSCDHFVEPKHLVGNIRSAHMLELVNSERQRAFGAARRDTLPRYCRQCRVRFADGDPRGRITICSDSRVMCTPA
jgi:uncharacterized protein